MSKKLTAAAPSIASGKVPAPVKVKLKRVNCDHAFGTASSAFVEASLYQLIAAARLPNSGICEIAVNASLAFIAGAKPRDEIECALVIQMACTHSAAMTVLNRLGGAAGDRNVSAMASAAARLLRAYATQVEALRRLRHGGSQTLRVEHVRR
jgi:hypothetical protein